MHEFSRSNAATNKVSPWCYPSLPVGNFNLRPWFPTNCTTAVALDLFSQGAGSPQPRYPRSSSRILKKPGQSQHQHQLSTLVLASAASTQISSQHFAIPKGIKCHQMTSKGTTDGITSRWSGSSTGAKGGDQWLGRGCAQWGEGTGGALQLFEVKVGGCCCKIRYVVWIMLRKCSLYYQHFV